MFPAGHREVWVVPGSEEWQKLRRRGGGGGGGGEEEKIKEVTTFVDSYSEPEEEVSPHISLPPTSTCSFSPCPAGEAPNIGLFASSLKTLHQDWVRGGHTASDIPLPPTPPHTHTLPPSLPPSLTRIDKIEQAEGRLLQLWRKMLSGRLDLEAGRRMVKMTVINICSIHQGPKSSGMVLTVHFSY